LLERLRVSIEGWWIVARIVRFCFDRSLANDMTCVVMGRYTHVRRFKVVMRRHARMWTCGVTEAVMHVPRERRGMCA
jgi:hypothetical protein